jgi:hypothetical protein
MFKWLAAILVVAFVAAQFIRRPQRTNPPFVSTHGTDTIVAVPPDVRSILRRACADCHSDEARWPWYSYVAPTSWFVVGRVNHGRRFINFSTWVYLGKELRDSIDRLKVMCREVKRGRMPLKSYKLLPWHWWLSADDVNGLCECQQRNKNV